MFDEFKITIPARDVPVTIHWKVGDSYTDKASGMLYTKTENGWNCSLDPDYTDCANGGCWEGGNSSDTRIKFFRKDKGIASPKTGELYCCQSCMESNEPEEEWEGE